MITRIEIDGFKSFKDFAMEFTPLTVIAGTNASGKSNLFDALQLLSRIAETDLRTAFGEQRGDADELFLQYSNEKSVAEMSFAVEMLVDKKVKDNWGQQAELDNTRLRYEIKIRKRTDEKGFEELFVCYERLVNIKHDKDQWIKTIPEDYRDFWRPSAIAGKRGTPYIDTKLHNNVLSLVVAQDGKTGSKRILPVKEVGQSVLSGFNNVDFKHIFAVREEMRTWKTMQLNPASLRNPTLKKWTDYSLSRDGENLAGLLYQLSAEDEYFLVEIANTLNSFIPGFTEVKVEYSEAMQTYHFKLKNSNGQEFSARLLSDGTLRFLALCVILYNPDQRGILCFEEPENGVHPYQIRSMLQLLKKISEPFNNWENGVSQVIVNTHSPIVVDEAMKRKDANTGVWFMRMDTLITAVGDRRTGMRVTRSTPVVDKVQPLSDYSEQEQKITIQEVKKYLNLIPS